MSAVAPPGSGRAHQGAAARGLSRDAHHPRVRGAPAPRVRHRARSRASSTSTPARRRSPPASCAHLGSDDYIASTHRGHGHAIAKGCDVKGDDGRDLRQADRHLPRQGRLDAHRRPVDRGMLGANGIVGGGPPLVCGVGLTAQGQAAPTRSRVSFTGDGGSNQGTFLESLNLAAALAPARASSWSRTTATPSRRRAQLPPERASTSPSAPTASACPASSSTASTSSPSTRRPARRSRRARAGGGPTLLECKVDRYFGHFEGDQQTYRGAGRGRGPAPRPRLPRRVPRRVTDGRASLERRRSTRSTRPSRTLIDERRRRGQGGARPDARRRAHRRLRHATEGGDTWLGRITYQQAINEALAQEMERDETVVVFGEDVVGGTGAPRRGRRLGRRARRHQGPVPQLPGPRARHADLRVGAHRRGGRRGGLRAAPRRRAHVRRLPGRLPGPDLQPGGEVPLHVRRQGA